MTPQSVRRPGELVFALILVIFAAAAFWQSYGISGFAGKTTAGVFPMLASGTMVVSGLVILLTAVRKAPPEGNPTQRVFREVLPVNHLVLIALVAAYVGLMPVLGFIASSALFLFCAFQFLWRRNPALTALLTAIALMAVYVLFREVFQVVLPQGSLLRGIF